jgi:hypothetical protein
VATAAAVQIKARPKPIAHTLDFLEVLFPSLEQREL